MSPAKGEVSCLFITPYLPLGTGGAVTGAFRRQQMLMDGIVQVADVVHVLALTPPGLIANDEPAVANAQRALAERWRVRVVLTVCEQTAGDSHGGFWGAYGKPAFSVFSQTPFKRYSAAAHVEAVRRALAAKHDLVFAHRLHAMMPLLRLGLKVPRLFLDLDDLEHMALMRGIQQPPVWMGKRMRYLHVPALMAAERRSVRMATRALVCSRVDQQRLSQLAGTRNVEALPNAVNVPAASSLTDQPTLTILGGYDFLPNLQGAEYFLDAVWPQVLSRVPQARLIVAGPNPQLLKHHRSPPRAVEFPGLVPDLADLYAQTRVSVCPILWGSGTRLKIVEAAAFGKPIVSTTLGAEGTELEHGREILLADSPQAMADACVRVLTDDALAAGLGQAARAVALTRFDSAAVSRRLADILRAT